MIDQAASALPGRTLVNLTNGTPAQARAMAERVTGLGAAYLDGGIMATPPMIGGEHALILYSGSKAAFDAHAEVLEELGAANYLGTDAGLASLHDLALLSGMYGLFAGFFHASALVDSEGIPAGAFFKLLGPWMTAMMGELPDMPRRSTAAVTTSMWCRTSACRRPPSTTSSPPPANRASPPTCSTPCWTCSANGTAPDSGTRTFQAYSSWCGEKAVSEVAWMGRRLAVLARSGWQRLQLPLQAEHERLDEHLESAEERIRVATFPSQHEGAVGQQLKILLQVRIAPFRQRSSTR
nr:hypothetical protein [Mesorhizobium amorphae]